MARCTGCLKYFVFIYSGMRVSFLFVRLAIVLLIGETDQGNGEKRRYFRKGGVGDDFLCGSLDEEFFLK